MQDYSAGYIGLKKFNAKIMIILERLKSILFKQNSKFSQDVVYME